MNTESKQTAYATSDEDAYFDPDLCVIASEVQMLRLAGKIVSVYIHRADGDFYVSFATKAGEEYFLGTRRKREAPRIFVDIERMEGFLEKLLPGIDVNFTAKIEYDE